MQRKIFIQSVLMIVIPSSLLFFFANQLYINLSIDSQIETHTRLIDEMRKNLDTKFDYYRQMTIQFYLNDQAMDQVRDDTPILDCRHIFDQLSSFVNSNRLISSAYLFTEKGSVYSGAGMLGVEELNRDLQDELLARGGKILWTSTRQMKSNYGLEQDYFFGCRHIRKADEKIATLYLGFGELFWDEFFEYTPFSDSQAIIVCDSKGNIIASNSGMPPGEQIYGEDVMSEFRNRQLPSRYDSVDNSRIILASKSENSDWFVTVAISPLTISARLNGIRNIFYLSFLFYLLFFFSLSYLLSRKLSKPLHDLTLALNKVGDGKLNVRVNENQVDEVKQLSMSFNSMTQRIANLLIHIKEEEKEKQKVIMQTLQLQLTPHFLYNTLNTIRWMAQMNGQNNIKDITKALISFLKEVSDIQSEFLTVDEEISLLRNYSVIQSFRYRNFHLKIDADESVRMCFINKMIMVNLMENSILHGFHEKEGEGEIRIRITSEEKRLVILFSDNGVGFNCGSDCRELSEIGEEWEYGHGHIHTGLSHIEKRLRLYFGNDQNLEIESSPGEGCSVRISLPLLTAPPDS